MGRETITICIYIIYISCAFGQQDTFNIASTEGHHKNFIIPAIEVIGFNTMLNRLDLLVLKREFARVSWDTWKENIQNGFKSDGDRFGTNFLGHPYQGSIFFNAARSYNHSFWESIPYTMAGCLIWEYFGENEPPSEIDLGTTFYGGIYLGELTHRLTSLLGNRRNSKKKIWRQSVATIINPMGQLNGLLTDNSFRFDNEDVIFDFPIRSQLSVGMNFPFGKIGDRNPSKRMHINYSMLYGDLFDSHKTFKPFDFIVLRSWADVSFINQAHMIFFNITSHAALWRKSLTDKSAFTISSHYDFLNNEIFKLGASSITGDYSLIKKVNKINFLGSARFGVVLFGSSNAKIVQYLQEIGQGVEGFDEFLRDYVYGHGLTSELECLIEIENYGKLIVNFNHWLLYIRKDAYGTEHSSIFEATYYYPVYKNWSIGLQIYYYNRTAHYRDYPLFNDINHSYADAKILMNFTF